MAIKNFSFVSPAPSSSLYTKGLEDDDTEIEKMLREVVKYSDIDLRSLPNNIEIIHKQIRRKISILDCEGFTKYQTLIREIFTRPSEPYKPGTIGSFYIGCSLEPKQIPEGITRECLVSCAGQIPCPAEDQKWKTCEYPVYWIEYDKVNDRFQALMLSAGVEDKKKDAIFFYDLTNERGLPPFGTEDIQNFQRDGIERVRILGYDWRLAQYHDDGRGVVPIISLLAPPKPAGPFTTEPMTDFVPRGLKIVRKDGEKHEHGGSGMGVGIVVVIIVILFLFLFYRSRK